MEPLARQPCRTPLRIGIGGPTVVPKTIDASRSVYMTLRAHASGIGKRTASKSSQSQSIVSDGKAMAMSKSIQPRRGCMS